MSWLASAIDPAPSPTPAAAALATMRRTIGPGVRAGLLRAFYLLGALMVGLLLFGSREGGPLPESEQTKLAIGLWPLFGFAFAFLAVLMQRVVLGGERKVRQAASVSHRVASAHFPLCLLIGLLQASGLVAGQPGGRVLGPGRAVDPARPGRPLPDRHEQRPVSADPGRPGAGRRRRRVAQAPTHVRPLPGG